MGQAAAGAMFFLSRKELLKECRDEGKGWAHK